MRPSYGILTLPRTTRLILLAASFGYFSTQGWAQATSTRKTADEQWGDVVALTTQRSNKSVETDERSAVEQKKAHANTQVQQNRSAAVAAKDFYTQNPDHPKAREARKLEAIAAVRGITKDDETYVQSAMAIARQYRGDTTQSVSDRFQVALTMERAEMARRAQAGAAIGRNKYDVRQLALIMRSEFGDQPELYTYFMEVANTLDAAVAQELATSTLKAPLAPASAKDRARVMVDRAALIGRPITLNLPGFAGAGGVSLSQSTGQVTLLIAWSPADPESIAKLGHFKTILPADSRVVYLGLGGSEGQIKKAESIIPVPGIHCHATVGASSRAAMEALKLKYAPLPRIYIINAKGTLVAEGKIDDLPVLIGRVAK